MVDKITKAPKQNELINTVNEIIDQLGTGTANVSLESGDNITIENVLTYSNPIKVGTRIFESVSYSNGKFVAVGYSGYITTSTDGVTWTEPVQVGTRTWHGITYGNNKFVAVGEKGYTTTSTDGVTWTEPLQVSTSDWYDITYGNGKFVAVGTYTVTSTDGTTWTEPTSHNAYIWYGITYGNGKFVAVGEKGYTINSTDGTTWTIPVQISGQAWRAITYGNNTFVAVGDYGNTKTSTDGITWTTLVRVGNFDVFNGWNDVTYGIGKFVAIGYSGYITTSTDGVTWTEPIQVGTNTWNAITYANSKFIVVGYFGYVFSIYISSYIISATIPDVYVTETELSTELGDYTPTDDLGAVALSNSYNDLDNKPTIPDAQVNSDWNATSGKAQILNKPELFSGDYNDLDNKPTIPTVNNAEIEIQKNSTKVSSFTTNQGGNKQTINITVPTTASDVGALPNSTKYGSTIDVTLSTTDYKQTITLKDQDGNTLSSKFVDFPVESMVVSGTYDSTNKKIVLTLQNGNTTDIPVGDLIAGLQTEITSSNKLSADLISDGTTNKTVTQTEKNTWNDKQNAISDLSTIRSNAQAGKSASDTISGYGDIVTHDADEFLTEHQDLSGYQTKITSSNKLSADLLSEGTTNKLVSASEKGTWNGKQNEITSSNKLSADLISDGTTNKTVTAIEKNTWNGKQNAISDLSTIRSGASAGATAVQPDDLATVATSGSYNDLSNKPTIPAAQIQSDWNQTTTTAKDYIKNKPSLSTVATSGSYNDLTDKPTIPAQTDVKINNTSITSSGVANIVTNTAYNASSNKIATMSDLPTDSTVSGWGFTKNAGTITGIKMNGSSKGTSGVVDLGTVITSHQDISGKANTNLSNLTSAGNNLVNTALNTRDNTTRLKFWTGTKKQYDAISTKDNNTLYNIIDDQDITLTLLQTIYPVGSVYLSTNATCPLASLFGTWTLVSSGKALWTGTGSNGGSTIEAGLPDHYHLMSRTADITNESSGTTVKASYDTVMNFNTQKPDRNFKTGTVTESESNPIYGNSTTVQPPAYVVNVWRRTA